MSSPITLHDDDNADSIVMYVEVQAREHPRLFADLMAVAKGKRRVNRLRLLATQGLLAEVQPLTPSRVGTGGTEPGAA